MNRVEDYMVDAERLKNDFHLLFSNCFTFNSPKDKVYKEGQRIKQIIDKKIESKMEKLTLNALKNWEEFDHLKWVKEQIDLTPNFFYADVKIPIR